MIVYDGKGKWETFLRKFKMFLRQNNVTYIGGKHYYFSLALDGKVGDYLMRLKTETSQRLVMSTIC